MLLLKLDLRFGFVLRELLKRHLWSIFICFRLNTGCVRLVLAGLNLCFFNRSVATDLVQRSTTSSWCFFVESCHQESTSCAQIFARHIEGVVKDIQVTRGYVHEIRLIVLVVTVLRRQWLTWLAQEWLPLQKSTIKSDESRALTAQIVIFDRVTDLQMAQDARHRVLDSLATLSIKPR